MIAPVAPTLTAKTDPCPGVEVYFPTLDAAADTITVWRTADGVTEEVAGAKRATVAGDFVVTDSQVPFGVLATYVGEAFDSTGASLLGAQSTIQVDSDEVWFQNAVDPAASFTVELNAASLSPVERATHNQQQWVAGLPRPFNQFWGEGAIAGLPLVAWSNNSAETADFRSITSWPQLLVRTPPSFETLPRLLYAAVQRSSHNYLVNVEPGAAVVWNLVVDEVQPFSKSILRPLVTWDDWTAAFPGGVGVWDGAVGLSASRTPANLPLFRNLSTNPSGEVSAAGYAAVPGTSGTAAVTSANPSTTTAFGAKVLKTTWSVASSAAGGGVSFDVAVTAGQVVSVQFGHVKASIGNRLQLSIEWRTASATISTVTATAIQVTAGAINTGFKLENVTAPATATVARVKVLSVAGTGYANWSIGSYLEVDGMLFPLGATTTLTIAPRTNTYLEGGSQLGYLWNDVMAVYGAGTWTDAVRNPPNA